MATNSKDLVNQILEGKNARDVIRDATSKNPATPKAVKESKTPAGKTPATKTPKVSAKGRAAGRKALAEARVTFLSKGQSRQMSRIDLLKKRYAKRVNEEGEGLDAVPTTVCPNCGGDKVANIAADGGEAVFSCPDCDNTYCLVNTEFIDAITPDDTNGIEVAVITVDVDGDYQAIVADVVDEVEVEEIIDAVDQLADDGAIVNVKVADGAEGEIAEAGEELAPTDAGDDFEGEGGGEADDDEELFFDDEGGDDWDEMADD
jgi:rubrerythrin